MNKKSALTLTELLVATVIMGIIISGVASVDIGIRKAFRGTTENAIVSSEVSAIMHHIATRISQATGWIDNPGILIDNSVAEEQRLYIRIDELQTPENYDDHSWVCYDFRQAHRGVMFCPCAPGASCDPATSQWLQRGRITQFNPSGPIFDFDASLYHVEITLQGVFNPSEEENPVSNPEFTLTSRFYLPSMSMH